MIDSFGRSVPEYDFGGGDGGAAGADGSAGDGKPIANASVTLKDNAGNTATTTTDSQGYYRVKVKGFTPPFIASVVRPDKTVWYSPSIAPVKTRGFVTINITGLTDKVASDVSLASGITTGGAAFLTPPVIAANLSALQAAKDDLNTQLAGQICAAGLNAGIFDPVTTPYQAIATDPYDKLLESVVVVKDPSTGITRVGASGAVVATLAGRNPLSGCFSSIASVAIDSADNIYAADMIRSVIQKISPASVSTLLAGSGAYGTADGTGKAASFKMPFSIALDSTGNIFVADTGNHTIRKVSASGVVTTLAGIGGLTGSADGAGSDARFNEPSGVAVDGVGNVFVADRYNHAIRKITSAGLVSTLAGGSPGFVDGTGVAAKFLVPQAVAVDGSDNVFVADTGNNSVRKVTPAGGVTTLAGSGAIGLVNATGTAASFSAPTGITVDETGTVFVADTDNNAIRKISSAGAVTTLAGSGLPGNVDATGTAASFSAPSAIVLDKSGNLYVADVNNAAIRKVTPAGVVTTRYVSSATGFENATGTAASFNLPSAVAVDSAGNIYVGDTFNLAIRKITPSAVVTTLAGSGKGGSADGLGAAASFQEIYGVAVDSLGNVYVADTVNQRIRKISPAGDVTTLAGSGDLGAADGQGSAASFADPMGIAVDSSNNVYVADNRSNLIRKISPTGLVSTLAGSLTADSVVRTGFDNGVSAAATFNQPQGIAVDGEGNVYVADTGNHAIRKITALGVVSTLAGEGTSGFANANGVAAKFDQPRGIAVDSAGNVYVADTRNSLIRKISSTGDVTTLAGVDTPSVGVDYHGYLNGPALTSSFYFLQGVAVDAAGNVYVADTMNSQIRKIFANP